MPALSPLEQTRPGTPPARVLDALAFAAHEHRGQRRQLLQPLNKKWQRSCGGWRSSVANRP